MWQTRHVMASFATHGVVSTVLQISTKGDRVQDRSLAALGTDSIFVKELELALRDGRADYAVHSCKDLPSTLPDDMHLAAIGPRVDPRDAFCSERYASFDALPHGALVGTSSPRRRAQLQALRPDVRFEIIRGNVDTRLRKLREGDYDAILLAMAGLQRLGLSATYTVPLETDLVIPAVGQGALAIETRANDPELARRIAAIFTHRETELAVSAERAFLRTLRGSCQAPVGAHAVVRDGTLHLDAAIAAIDGSRIVRGSDVVAEADVAAAERLGESLAHRLSGGRRRRDPRRARRHATCRSRRPVRSRAGSFSCRARKIVRARSGRRCAVPARRSSRRSTATRPRKRSTDASRKRCSFRRAAPSVQSRRFSPTCDPRAPGRSSPRWATHRRPPPSRRGFRRTSSHRKPPSARSCRA